MILEDNGVNKKNFKLNLEFFLLTTVFDLVTFLLMKIWIIRFFKNVNKQLVF